MIQVPDDKRTIISGLFSNWDETMIWSYLQGHMGCAWTDNLTEPKSARIIIGDFCFLAGTPDPSLIIDIPTGFKSEQMLMIPKSGNWNYLIEDIYKERHVKSKRYATAKNNDFNLELLKEYIDKLPKEYTIKRINKELYTKILEEKWSRDLCSQFASYEDYKERGLGFAAIYNNGEIVSGASSYTVYDNGIEIEIDTKQGHRRRGLALASAASLIKECIANGIYPSWDAANKESVALAEMLGYNVKNEYLTYIVLVK